MKSLRKKAALAPQYVLKLEGLKLYLAEKQNTGECVVTENISDAMKFAVGFDNVETKIGIWSATLIRQVGYPYRFEAVNL